MSNQMSGKNKSKKQVMLNEDIRALLQSRTVIIQYWPQATVNILIIHNVEKHVLCNFIADTTHEHIRFQKVRTNHPHTL